MPANKSIHYLVLDIESVADGALVSKLRYPGEGLEGEQAVARYRAELMEKFDNDFIPYTFQVPVSVAIAKLTGDFRLADLVVLDEPEFRPHVITEHFWKGWDKYNRPTLVTFNGRTFDLPLLELSAFRYGLSVPGWFNVQAKSFEQSRNRFNNDAQIDLQDLLTNYGATRFTGGLNLAANLLGKPGKMDVEGHMVQDMYEQGRLAEINEYCRCDVLDTYFVFLRSRVLLGTMSLDEEQGLVAETKTWLAKRCDEQPAYRTYLERWGDWTDPRKTQPVASEAK